jgi:hypothetical protein
MRLFRNIPNELLSLCAIVAMICLQGCACNYGRASAAKSPDGLYEAVLEEENCGGAVSSLTFDVSVYQLPRHDSFWPWASSPRKSVFSAGYAYHLKLEWPDNSHLNISCPGCSEVEIYHQERSWQAIGIQYGATATQRTEPN